MNKQIHTFSQGYQREPERKTYVANEDENRLLKLEGKKIQGYILSHINVGLLKSSRFDQETISKQIYYVGKFWRVGLAEPLPLKNVALKESHNK